jgi:hypothetical protein
MASAVLRLALASALALLSAPPATAAAGLPQRGIVGGQPATIAQVPWQVALIDTSHYGSPQQFCGGSIVDATHVVTAAHCLASPDSWSADAVYAGTTLLSDPQQVVSVSAQRIHPAYAPSVFANDVAVLTLAEPLTLDGATTRAVELAEESPAAGAALTVSGWGDTSNGQGLYPNQLRAVTVHAVADTTCAASYGPALATQLTLCAGEPAGGKDSCSGDSGGPLVNAGTNVLVGIVSFGHQCALADYPGVYAEIAAASVHAFIADALTDAEPDPPPPAAPEQPPIAPAPLPVGADPAPAPVVAPTPEDTTAPIASVRASRCTRTTCTLSIQVTDAGVSRGVRGVRATVRSQRAAHCRRHRKRSACTRTTAARSIEAVATGPDRYRLRATGLPAGATNRFSLVAEDNAGHRQLAPTVARVKTRRAAR